jgi:predicted nucleic acid-binding protein
MPNSWICVDANLVIRLVVDPTDEAVRGLWERWEAAGRQLAAPNLLRYEVTNALYRYQRLGFISAASVRLAMQAAFALPLDLQGGPELHWRALELAERFSLPAAYDAQYLALAERLGGEFWTADGALARMVHPAMPWVYLVE